MTRPAILLAALSLAGCGDDSAAPRPDAAPNISMCVQYEATSCIFRYDWEVSPDDPTFPTYTVLLRASPAGEGYSADVSLRRTDDTPITVTTVALTYDPQQATPTGMGASVGSFQATFCDAPGSSDGDETHLDVVVHDPSGGVYVSRNDTPAVLCIGATCPTDCPML